MLNVLRKCHVKVGDNVAILSGKDKNKQGRIVALSPREGKAIVSGINKVKKHLKARKVGDDIGIIEVEAPIYTCKLQLICPKCNKQTRIAHKLNSKNVKVRVCKKCNNEISLR